MEESTTPAAECPQPATETGESDLRGTLIARRDQLTAAFQENAQTLQQIERELEQRRAAQHQMFGSIKTLNDILEPQAEAVGG